MSWLLCCFQPESSEKASNHQTALIFQSREISRKKISWRYFMFSHFTDSKRSSDPFQSPQESCRRVQLAWDVSLRLDKRQASHLAVNRNVTVDKLLNVLNFRLDIIKWDCYFIALLNLLAGVIPEHGTVQMQAPIPTLPALSPGNGRKAWHMVVVTSEEATAEWKVLKTDRLEVHDWRETWVFRGRAKVILAYL